MLRRFHNHRHLSPHPLLLNTASLSLAVASAASEKTSLRFPPPCKSTTFDLMAFRLFFLFLSLSLVSATDSLHSPQGINYEVAALMSVKNKMRDLVGVMDGWDINSVDPCTWSMVACSPDGVVISLEMARNGLEGTLSPSIGNLTHLQTVLLQNNKISGCLPLEIGKLTQLKTLDVSSNHFTGEIPSSLGYLTQLSYMRLNHNNLTGQIPGSVANLTGLLFLDLSFNNLTGPTPKILAKEYSVVGNEFLCISTSSPQDCMDVHPMVANETNMPQKSSNQHHLVLDIAVSLGSALAVAIMLFILWMYVGRWCSSCSSHGIEADCEIDMGHLKRFSFRELQIATNNFNPKNILGHGGFGVVYKGTLRNTSVVAVKRLQDPNFTGEVQFQTEVEMIGLALHRNLLRLYGFCMTPNERLLIYPFMQNGSVADRLRDRHGEKPTLDWNKRMCIILGAARGLVYLHEQCNPKIIHRDVKAANILLDESFEAVVGDFGLAKLLDQRDSHVTTAVRGTIGHIAPEYLSTGQSSEKTDVFGFGILILDVITGAGNGLGQKGMILDWVRHVYEEKKLEMLVDRDLKACFDPIELENTVKLALLCTLSHPGDRPKMSDVVKALECGWTSGLGDHIKDHGGDDNNNNTLYSMRSCSFSDAPVDKSSNFEAIELSGPR